MVWGSSRTFACRFPISDLDVGRAGWWLLANALAWAVVGMSVVFAWLHVAYIAVEPWVVGSFIIGTLVLAGALVGTIHGIF